MKILGALNRSQNQAENFLHTGINNKKINKQAVKSFHSLIKKERLFEKFRQELIHLTNVATM